MVLQVKDADGQGEFWDSSDGTRRGTRGLRQRQLPLCPSLLCVPPPGLSPLVQRCACGSPTPTCEPLTAGLGVLQRYRAGSPPSSYRVGSVGDSFPPDTPLGGRTDSSSASVFFLPSPHPSPPTMGWERKWPYHHCSPNQAAAPKPKPTETWNTCFGWSFGSGTGPCSVGQKASDSPSCSLFSSVKY